MLVCTDLMCISAFAACFVYLTLVPNWASHRLMVYVDRHRLLYRSACMRQSHKYTFLSFFLTDKTVPIQSKRQRRADRRAAAAARSGAAGGDLQQVCIQHFAGHPGLAG